MNRYSRAVRNQGPCACDPLEPRQLLAAPTLSYINQIDVPIDADQTVLTYEQLAAAADEFDADGDPLTFNLHGVAQEFIVNGVPGPSGFFALQPTGPNSSVVVDLISMFGGRYPPIIVTVTDGTSESNEVLMYFQYVSQHINQPPQVHDSVGPRQILADRSQPLALWFGYVSGYAHDPEGLPIAVRIEADPLGLLVNPSVVGHTLIAEDSWVFPGSAPSVALNTPLLPRGVIDAFTAVALDPAGNESEPFTITLDVGFEPRWGVAHLPLFGPVAPGGSIVIHYEDIIDLTNASTDGGVPPVLMVDDYSPRTDQSTVPPISIGHSTLTFEGTEAPPSFEMGPGDSVTWTCPIGYGEFAPLLMRIRLKDGWVNGSDQIEVAARVTVNLGADVPGPYSTIIGRGIAASFDPAAAELDIAYRNELGRVIIQGRMEGYWWESLDLTAEMGLGTVESDPVIWLDAKDGASYGAALANGGHVLLLRADDSAGGTTVSVRDLTGEIAGALPLSGQITQFVSKDGRAYLAGRTTQGHIVVYRQTGTGHAGDWAWTFEDLTVSHLDRKGMPTPQFTGALISYVTDWNGLNIAGLTPDGKIWGVWTAPGSDGWSATDLSEITHASTLSGGLTAFLTSWGGINLAGIDQSGHVSVVWWVPGFGGDWRLTDFTAAYGGTRLRPETISSFVSPWGALNVAGIDHNGDLQVYWWEPTRSGDPQRDYWDFTRLDAQPTGVDTPIIAPTSRLTTLASSDNQLHIFGVGLDGRAVRIWWRPDFGATWHGEVVQ